MIIRIVKMTFKPEEISTFKDLFEKAKPSILKFEGCTKVDLYQDIHRPEIMMTYSHWHDEQNLDQYRNSVFFQKTWKATKVLFSQKPEAWSLHESLPKSM